MKKAYKLQKSFYFMKKEDASFQIKFINSSIQIKF